MIAFNKFFPKSNHDAAVSISPIGFDLGHNRLNMLQMETVNDSPSIRAAVSSPYPCAYEELIAHPARFRAYVKQVLSDQPFAGKKVIACMPYGDDLKLVNIDFRKQSDESDQDAIIRELKERYGNELDQSIVDYLLIRSSDNDSPERSALVAIAKRQSVLSYLDLLHKAGLEVIALDIGPAALARVITALNKEKTHPNVLLINFGKQHSYLTVVWGRRHILDREIDFGEDLLLDKLSETLEISHEAAARLLHQHGFNNGKHEAKMHDDYDPATVAKITGIIEQAATELTNEINKTLIYIASKTRGGSVEHMYLLGSIIRFPNAVQWLNDLLSIPVDILNPYTCFDKCNNFTPPADQESAVSSAIATGLALRGLPRHDRN